MELMNIFFSSILVSAPDLLTKQSTQLPGVPEFAPAGNVFERVAGFWLIWKTIRMPYYESRCSNEDASASHFNQMSKYVNFGMKCHQFTYLQLDRRYW